VRATIPRIRYDHLIYLTWKNFLPISIGLIVLILSLVILI
jgi:NADH:ubiquinone oxidoreductase subunit H